MDRFFLVCTNDFYYGNRIFDLDGPNNRDNYYYPFHYLRSKLKEMNISLDTYDYLNKQDKREYGLIFFDIPANIEKYINDSNCLAKYLVIWESEIILPMNWNKKYHSYFDKIFTWNDDIVDNVKYFKINFSHERRNELNFDLGKKEKLCTLISAHKYKNHPLELYSERVRAIRWFEKNHPEDFDLYGMDWDKYRFEGFLSRLNKVVDRFKVLHHYLIQEFPSYKGKVVSKYKTYEKYKFAICYENARNIPGYITEKIFDCFYGSCVPVYWGPNNITEYVPASTFIDRRDFDTYEDIYDYIKNMSNQEYTNYLNSIREFVLSDKIYPFTAEYFANTLISNIVEGYSNEFNA